MRKISSRAGWRVIGYDLAPARRRALARAGVEIAADAVDVARKARTVITSLPKPAALKATATAIAKAKLPRRVIVEASTFTLEDKAAAEAVLRKAGHLMLDCPMSGTGAQAKVRDLVVYASGGPAEIKRLRPMFAGFTRARARCRRLRQRQPDEIRRQSAGRHQQCGERGGDGARA